ncbi:Bifunctional epoxide hydrolase 2 [Aphelenchoides fujianensis]|nr:Bifunctional epoxide hydrolase 2 [Aphelenchoides fujianensis]
MPIKAVFFDLYGVYMRYLDNKRSLELIRNILADDKIREEIFAYERGVLTCEDCLDIVAVSHPPIKNFENLEEGDFNEIVKGPDQNIVKAIHKLKKAGYKVGILCNNAYWSRKKKRSMIPDDLSLFDVVIESCRTGFRKSDPEIYWIAAESLGLECHECVLVDDSMLNVQGALDQGMWAVKQTGEDSKTAVEELEHMLFEKLL